MRVLPRPDAIRASDTLQMLNPPPRLLTWGRAMERGSGGHAAFCSGSVGGRTRPRAGAGRRARRRERRGAGGGRADAITLTPQRRPRRSSSAPIRQQTVSTGASLTFGITPTAATTSATGSRHHVAGRRDELHLRQPVTGDLAGNHTITATFAIDTFTITPTAGPGGTITPSTRPDRELRLAARPSPSRRARATTSPNVVVDGVTARRRATSHTFSNVHGESHDQRHLRRQSRTRSRHTRRRRRHHQPRRRPRP